MLTEYLLALLLLPLLLLVWVGVQNAWRRRFLPADSDDDALAGRSSCGRCGCASPCDRETTVTGLQRGDPDHAA